VMTALVRCGEQGQVFVQQVASHPRPDDRMIEQEAKVWGAFQKEEFAAERIIDQARQMFTNLAAVATAAGGSLDDLVKVNLYLTDLDNFQAVNQVMEEFFHAPFPARAAVGVAALPRGAALEAEAVMALPTPT
jgi:reactive intermediate/imine deaminase